MTKPKILQKYITRRGGRKDLKKGNITDRIWAAARHEHGSDYKRAVEVSDKVWDTIENTVRTRDAILTEDELWDITYITLVQMGHQKTGDTLNTMQYGEFFISEGKLHKEDFSPDGIPRELKERSRIVNEELDCSTIAGLNTHIAEGRFPQIISAAEIRYDVQLHKLYREFKAVADDMDAITIAGLSAAGKTTTAQRLSILGKADGIETLVIPVDYYFRNRSEQKINLLGHINYEDPFALLMDVLNENISDLLAGKETIIPYYDFKTGIFTRFPDRPGHKVRLKEGQKILIDSFQGMYPPLTEAIAPERNFKVFCMVSNYLENNNGIPTRWDDIHLLRRTLRDMRGRDNDTPDKTLNTWYNQRKCATQYILPYIKTANFVMNGGLQYGLPMLVAHLNGQFPTPEQYQGNKDRPDIVSRVERVHNMIQQVDLGMSPQQFIDTYEPMIPGNSVMREFIGGGDNLGAH